jgi:hypothetical protein
VIESNKVLTNVFSSHSFTLENRRLGTVIASMARSFEKESYLEEVNRLF